jgi:hypothetical protein
LLFLTLDFLEDVGYHVVNNSPSFIQNLFVSAVTVTNTTNMPMLFSLPTSLSIDLLAIFLLLVRSAGRPAIIIAHYYAYPMHADMAADARRLDRGLLRYLYASASSQPFILLEFSL